MSGPLGDAVHAAAFHAAPVALLLLSADDLVMVDANAAYLDAVGMPREQIVGRRVFDAFPANPTDNADEIDLPALFARTIETGEQQTLAGVRYDIPTASGDRYETHWWNVVETPVPGPSGAVEYLLHYTEEVTALVQARADLHLVEESKETAAQLVATLAEVSLTLASATTAVQIQQTVRRGLDVLGVAGESIVRRSPRGTWAVTLGDYPSDGMRERFSELPADSPLPAAVVARSGRRVLLPDRAAGLRYTPEMADVYELTGRGSWAFFPLTVEDDTLGSMVVSWAEPREFPDEELDLLEGLAAQCAQALHRIELSEAEHRVAAQLADMAEALQTALLTPPPARATLEIAVRYETAVDATQVGGDWYDAFEDSAGETVLVIGDVAGHDSAAAARMGQLRGILRTLAHTRPEASPAQLLQSFEIAARGLRVDALATGVLARVETVDGRRVVRWSNAGHPPPILVTPDGERTVLDPKPDLLLGVDAGRARSDHVHDFPDGATLLLYTDGLIERRATGMDEGIRDLRAALGDLADLPLPELCERVLQRLEPHTGEDDIAILAVRAL